MIFPKTNRFIYLKNPLDEVISQLRFPPILSIEKDTPYEFQEKIRAYFPEFEELEEIQFPVQAQNIDEVPSALLDLARQTRKKKNFAFLSENRRWKINLSRDFISISTLEYSRWEDFLGKFSHAVENLLEIYNPPYYSRIGLRYRNKIDRSSLNLHDVRWEFLLKEQVLGFLGYEDFEKRTDEFQSTTVLDLHEINSKVRIHTELIDGKNGEKVFMIDNDFFTNEKTNTDQALIKLNAFHKHTGPLFRMCFTEKLHEALEPKEL
jgi:uncharacterized protein (TIGR04255 family)